MLKILDIYIFDCDQPVGIADWRGIHGSQDLAFVEQHDIWIKTPNR